MEECFKKAEKYLGNLRRAFATLEKRGKECERVLDLAEMYYKDAAYYLEKGDCIVSISCSAYAEGLLDAARIEGCVSFEWPEREEPLVVVGGAFEIIHPGHLAFLKEARKRGRVVAVVARDATVKRNKGRDPIVPEEQRLNIIRSIVYVDKAILGNDPFDVKAILRSIRPDIIFLGPDQHSLEKHVRKAIEEMGLQTRIEKMGKRVDGKLLSTSEIIRRARSLAFTKDPAPY